MEANFEKTLGYWLGTTTKMIDLYIQDVFQEHQIKLSKIQWVFLKILNNQDGRAQQELAFLTNRDKTSLTRLVNTMEKKGLVKRTASKEDKRIKLIYLTEEGRRIFQSTLPIMKKIVSSFQQGISIEEIETAVVVLQRIQQNLKHNRELAL